MTKLDKIKLVFFVLFIIFFARQFYQWRADYMQEYARANNCRWDYNDMCYTREQKPWLFND